VTRSLVTGELPLEEVMPHHGVAKQGGGSLLCNCLIGHTSTWLDAVRPVPTGSGEH
jgi:hypothetical protein